MSVYVKFLLFLTTSVTLLSFDVNPTVSGQQSSPVNWLSSPADQFQPLNGTAVFDCFVQPGVDGRTVIWTSLTDDGQRTILFTNSVPFNAPDRFRSIRAPDGSGYRLELSPVLEEDDAVYECDVQRAARKAARLTVIVAPGRPVVSTNSTPSRGWREGDTVQLTCVTSRGNPSPNVTWYRNDDVITSGATVAPATTKFGTTSGSLVRRLTSSDDGAEYACVVQNIATVSGLRNSIRLDVQYAPVISFGPFNPLTLVESSDVTLVCNVSANPPVDVAFISWYQDGIWIGDGGRLRLRSVTSSDAGNYTCVAQNYEQRSAQLNVIVQYSPKPVITMRINGVISNNSAVPESSRLTFSCSFSNSNPPAIAGSTFWKRDGSVLQEASRDLVLTSVGRSDAGRYECGATNTLAPSGESQRNSTGTAGIALHVLFKPGATVVTIPDVVIKGDSVTLVCNATNLGNPAADLTWSRDGVTGPVAVGAKLVLDAARLSDSGNYTCTAVNTIGVGPAGTVILHVYERPEWLSSDRLPANVTSSVNQSSTQQLKCTVHGVPAPSITWYKDSTVIGQQGDGLFRVNEERSYRADLLSWVVISTLIYQGASRSPTETSVMTADAGHYTCNATNTYLVNGIQQTARLIVFFSPIINSEFSSVAADIGESATLTVHVVGFPLPVVTWYNGSNIIPTDSRSRIKVVTSGDTADESTMKSVLTVFNVNVWDFTEYTAVARNAYGSNQTTIQLTLPAVPSPPSHLIVESLNWESVELSWKAGNSGGRFQEFTISYRPTADIISVHEQQQQPMTVIATNSTSYNITGLYPSVNYTINVHGLNSVGRSLPVNVSITTSGFTIPPPAAGEVIFDPKSGKLSLPASDNFCARIDISYDAGTDDESRWKMYASCQNVSSGLAVLDDVSDVSALRLAFCLYRRPDVCSQSVLAKLVTSPEVSAATLIIVGCVCGLLVVALCVILAVVCCRRYTLLRKREKLSSVSTQSSSPVSSESAMNNIDLTVTKSSTSNGLRFPGFNNSALDRTDLLSSALRTPTPPYTPRKDFSSPYQPPYRSPLSFHGNQRHSNGNVHSASPPNWNQSNGGGLRQLETNKMYVRTPPAQCLPSGGFSSGRVQLPPPKQYADRNSFRADCPNATPRTKKVIHEVIV